MSRKRVLRADPFLSLLQWPTLVLSVPYILFNEGPKLASLLVVG